MNLRARQLRWWKRRQRQLAKRVVFFDIETSAPFNGKIGNTGVVYRIVAPKPEDLRFVKLPQPPEYFIDEVEDFTWSGLTPLLEER